MLLSFFVIFAVLICSKSTLHLGAVLCLPIIMLVEYILALGFTMIMSAVTVYIRDLEYLLGIFTMAWQFLTPVMYPIDQVPEQIRWVFSLNPMTYVITAYRDILYYGKMPRLETLLSAAVLGVIMLSAGWMVFYRLQRHFVEEL